MISRIAVILILLVVSIQSANASSFGRTAGKFGVSQVGGAQYSIPIWVPPGPRGIQPNISLSYDSQSGIGTLGLGWKLSGLASIGRCNKTVAQDSIPALVGLVTTDGFCINGNRLRLTGGTYGTDGSTYQTEIADFSNVIAHGAAGQGPAYFTVQGRDGLTYDYGYVDSNGNGANSQVLATGTTTAAAWMLSKVIDRAGNNYVINYTGSSGTAIPNTILWTPTSAGASTYTYKMQFNYTTNVPQGTIYKYLDGTVATNNQLLASIELFNGTTVLKDYFLGYQISPSTGRNELNSITECADAAQTNCLLPSSVAYQAGTAGVSTTAATALSSTGACLTARYDLNGDGIADLVYSNGTGVLFVAFGTGSGYGTPISVGITSNACPLIGNLTGGGEDGILSGASGTWKYYTWNGTSFVSVSTGLAFDSTAGYQLADIDGDGRPDLISIYNTFNSGTGKTSVTVYTRLNTSTAGTPSFSATLTLASTLSSTGGGNLVTPDSQYGALRRFDFNGDGRDDLAIEIVTGTSPNFIVSTYEMLSTGSTFTLALISSGSGSSVPVFFADWNDDACTDFVAAATLYISGCNGTTPATFSVGNVLAAADWDGDGRTDLIVSNGSTLGVYLSTGAGVTTLQPTSIPYSSTCKYVTMDLNGDGMDDLGCWSQAGTNPLTYYLHNAHSDLASSFADGYGVTYTPTYVSLAASGGVYTKGASAVFPNQDYKPATYVVSSYTSTDGIGGTYPTSFSYAGAIINLQGRGFQGFTTVSATDGRSGLKDTRTFSTLFPNAGMRSAESVSQSAGINVSVASSTLSSLTLDGTANNQRYFPYTAFSSINTYEVQVGGSYNGQLITTTTSSPGTPDIYGNFSSVVTTVTDEDSGSPYFGQQWTTTTATTISASPGTWCNSLPTERDVTNTAPGVPAIARHLSLTPDYSLCRETQQVVESGNATYQVTTGYSFDAFGNINSQTVTGIGMAARTTSINWGTTGQFPTTVTNALNQITHTNFDPNSGKLLSVQDPNGISNSWLYDAFERKQQETRPDGSTTTWTFNNCATAGCVNTNNKKTVVQTNVNVGGTTLNIQNTYLDAFDRTLVTSKQMLSGAFDRNEFQYDNMGNVHQQAAPCTFVSCAVYWTVNAYDLVNRLIQSQRPISATNGTLQTTTLQYSGRTATTTDPQGKVITNITKVTGSVGRTKDNDNYYINFSHDAFGALLSVTDSLSNTLRTMTYAYGLNAFRISLADMDLGTRSYTVDALGETTAYSDGKGQSFSTTYDALSRPLIRTEPDLDTTWTWGTTAASFNIGKLQSITSTSTMDGTYSETYAFDSAGRPTTTIIAIPNAVSGTYTNTYNATTGLLDTVQYPLSTSSYKLKLQYGYAHGILQSVSDFNAPTTVFWTANSVNPRGQVTQETLGNGVVSARSFDAVTGWLSSILAGVGSGSGIQNNAYLYDEMGNVTQRQDNNQGLTEDFFYDNLYRLDHSTLGAATNLQMHYDAMGNITSRSDIAAGATWTYDPVHKHQATQAGNSSFAYTYDANGNMNTRLTSTNHITWTSANYPINVGGPGETTNWSYGPNRQVYRSYQQGNAGNETTYHYGRLFEVVTFGGNSSNYRHYIKAGNELVAIYSRTFLGVNTLNYIQSDHQGSIASITTSSPATDYVNESFTAFGNRRNGQTWSGAATTADETAINAKSRWGYTLDTAILIFTGLVHMNGRIEDAGIGRFLSPDPRGTTVGNTQSWNRYSYVNNNPLTFTDPSGFNAKRCADDCGQGGRGKKLGYDPGSLGPYSGYMSAIADGMQVPTGGNYPSDNSGPSIGSIGYNGDNGGTGLGGAVSTADAYRVGTHPATNRTYVGPDGLETVEVGIYSPDAPPSPAPKGANLAPYFASQAFTSWQKPMNAISAVTTAGSIAAAVVLAPESVAAVELGSVVSTATKIACVSCLLSTGSDLTLYADDMLETLRFPSKIETLENPNNIQTIPNAIETGEEGLRTFWRWIQTISGQ